MKVQFAWKCLSSFFHGSVYPTEKLNKPRNAQSIQPQVKAYIPPCEEKLSCIYLTRSGQTIRRILLQLKGNCVWGSILTPLWPLMWQGISWHADPGTWKNTGRGGRGENSQCSIALLPSFMKGDKVRPFQLKYFISGSVVTKFSFWCFCTCKRKMTGDFQELILANNFLK